MADDPQNPQGQMPAGTEPTQQPEPAAPQNGSADGQEPEGETFDEERAKALISKLRLAEKQAAKERKELETLRAERKAVEDAKLSEQERLTNRQKELERELEQERKTSRDRENRYQVQLQAGKLDIVDPEAAEKLLDWDSVEFDDKGRPTNLEDALKQLLKDRPYLQRPAVSTEQQQQPTFQVATTNSATRGAVTGTRIYSQAELMDYTFWDKNREDITAAMREGRIRN